MANNDGEKKEKKKEKEKGKDTTGIRREAAGDY